MKWKEYSYLFIHLFIGGKSIPVSEEPDAGNLAEPKVEFGILITSGSYQENGGDVENKKKNE